MTSPESAGMSSERLARIRPAVEKHIGDDKIRLILSSQSPRRREILDMMGLTGKTLSLLRYPNAILALIFPFRSILCNTISA